jgi:hypothetical protein
LAAPHPFFRSRPPGSRGEKKRRVRSGDDSDQAAICRPLPESLAITKTRSSTTDVESLIPDPVQFAILPLSAPQFLGSHRCMSATARLEILDHHCRPETTTANATNSRPSSYITPFPVAVAGSRCFWNCSLFRYRSETGVFEGHTHSPTLTHTYPPARPFRRPSLTPRRPCTSADGDSRQ